MEDKYHFLTLYHAYEEKKIFSIIEEKSIEYQQPECP